MGNYSYFVAALNNAAACAIDWDAMDTSILYKDYHLEDEHKKPAEERAKTLADMGAVWHGSKFIGYLNADYIAALMEFTRHLAPCGAHPRLYFEFEGYDELWVVEFVPGAGIVNIGSRRAWDKQPADYPKHPADKGEKYTDADEEKWAVENETYRKAAFLRLIDADGWSLRRLKHVEMSEAEQIAYLMARIHGRI
jgi:hypothetical protein